MDYVVIVFEDELSDAVMRRLLAHSGRPFVVHNSILARGNSKIRRDIAKYMTACKYVPHIVLTDLDQYPCPPALLESWGVANQPRELLFRVAVREIEAWLLADINGLSTFLGVSRNKFPARPEAETDPKQTLLNIVRRSKKRRMASEILPSPGSKAAQGPLYNDHLCGFVASSWNVEAASVNAPSLARTIARISDFMA
jgi:hypothetical protein